MSYLCSQENTEELILAMFFSESDMEAESDSDEVVVSDAVVDEIEDHAEDMQNDDWE